jgi:probable HAF family extracellular repeat protein
MKRQWRLYLLTFGFALGSAANILADGPNLTTVEFPGAILTNAFGINNRGDIVGNFMNADQSDHGFLLSGGQYTTIDFPGATLPRPTRSISAATFVGRYTLDGASRCYLVTGFRPACVAGD